MNVHSNSTLDVTTRRCLEISALCIVSALASGIYYALNVSVLQDGTFYEPEFMLLFSRFTAVAGITLAGYAIWRWTDSQDEQ